MKINSENLQRILDEIIDKEIQEKKIQLENEKAIYESTQYMKKCNDIYMLHNKPDVTLEYEKFKNEVTNAFVTEAVLCINNSCIDHVILKDEYNKNLSRQLVSNFVIEEGARNLINRFRRTSNLLSEVAYVCEQYINIVLESTDKKNKETFKVKKEDKDSFFNRLDKIDSDNAINTIRNRVMTATQDFIDSNTLDKMKIKNILQDTKEKIENNKSKNAEKINESYAMESKEAIQDIRNNKVQNVFESMVYSLAHSAVINENAKILYVENSMINMDKIVEHCEIIYNFLTTIDTLKMKSINEQYILNMLKDMKS